MHVISPIPKPTVGKTFHVAIGILGAVAVAQLLSIGWAFVVHSRSPQAAATLPKTAEPPAENLSLVDPFAAPVSTATPKPVAAPAPQEVASLPKPTPVPLKREPTPEGRISELVEQARALRERGDTSTALTRLREAQAIGSDKPLIIAEMALTFEKMGLTDKALEQWHRIFDMGDSAGIFFAAADAKIKSADVATRVEQPKPEPMRRDTIGLSPDSVIGLGEITTTEQADPNVLRKFTLKIPLKAQPNSNIDVHDVVIQVFFYDVVDDQTVVQTNANVSSHWLTLPADWKEDDIELLEVEYAQPKPDPKLRQTENRKFFGYVVRIYYQNNLQDRRAEPGNLLKQFPPPTTLSDETK